MNNININTGGGSLHITGSNIGGSGNTVNNFNVGSISTKEELQEILLQFISELEKSTDIPSDQSGRVKSEVEAAIDVAKKDFPSKEQVVERLTNVQKIFSSIKEGTASAFALGKLIGEIILAAKSVSF